MGGHIGMFVGGKQVCIRNMVNECRERNVHMLGMDRSMC